jgi:hypothetical protein
MVGESCMRTSLSGWRGTCRIMSLKERGRGDGGTKASEGEKIIN